MLKMISNVIRGRGVKAPALFARPKALLGRLVRASGGYALMGAGVVGAAVVIVSLLTFLAPDSERPLIGRPIGAVEAVQSVLPGVLEQVGDRVVQAATLLDVDGESIQDLGENMSTGLAAARSGSANAWAPTPGIPPAVGTAPTTPAPEGSSSSSPATDEPSPPQTASEPSTLSSGGGTGETSSPAPPPAMEALSPITSEPTSPPAVEEEPPPATEEPLPATEEPPPVTEEPTPPPTTEEPPPPPDEPAPPTVEQPPPVTDQPKA
jgi:hypothetical protein